MTYAAKGEKVFAYQDPSYPDCTPQWIKRSDHRLKRFQSAFDRRSWDYCEEVRYKHLYDMMSGSRTCLGIDSCHKYVPLEDLISILMGQKDEMIKRLQEEGGEGGNAAKKNAEKNQLLNQVAGLTDEVNKYRDMLRQAMHKLENIDEIVNENKKLQCRLRCSEERVKFLEEKKKKLESELEDLRSKSQIQMDLEKAQQMLCRVIQQREESTEMDEVLLQSLSLEKNDLQEKIKELENELKESKKKEAEIEMLKKKSESDSLSKEDLSRENECYRKKLASMKCLERQIQELKKQGRALADKYRRESQKAAEQLSRMSQASKELQSIREERDSLRKRVNELASYECQYNKLQRKLQKVDAVIAENENLNSKLCALQKLEQENEYLKCRLEAIQEVEVSAVDDKEKIMQLQCAVADQEEEMKELLGQIERLTSGRHEEEIQRLRCELYEKNCKLKLCEEQLAEVPMLEAEIDELRMKLQCCCREFPEEKREASSYQKVEVRFPSTSTGIRANYKTAMNRQEEGKIRITSECKDKKEMMICEEVQSLLQSSKGIISCVLEDMVEHQREMEELEVCNRAMKDEIETLKARVGKSDKECLFQEISNLKKALDQKNVEICKLKRRAGSSKEDDEDVETLRELNAQMKAELQAACIGLKKVAELERILEAERKARCEAEMKLHGGGPSTSEPGGVVPEDPNFDCCGSLQKEIQDLKDQIVALNNLTDELKKENELLRELHQPCPDFSKELDEKCALENLLSLLQAELDAFKGQKLSNECEALRCELKRLMEQNCQLKTLVNCYRQRLDLEKKTTQMMGGVMHDDRVLPFVTPSGNVLSSPSELKAYDEKKKLEAEGIILPMVTPSGRVLNTPDEYKQYQEKKKKEAEGIILPMVTPSGRVLNTLDEYKQYQEKKKKEAEGVKLPMVTPSGNVVNTPEELKQYEEKKKLEAEGIKLPMVTPSGRVLNTPDEYKQYQEKKKKEEEEKEKAAKYPKVTPSGKVINTPEELKQYEEMKKLEAEGIKLPMVTPSGRVLNTPDEYKQYQEKKKKEAEEKEKAAKYPKVTPSGKVINTPEELKQYEEKKKLEAEGVKLPMVTPSGKVVNTPDEYKQYQEKKKKEAEEKEKAAKYPKVTPSGRVVSSPSEEVKGSKPDKQAEANLKKQLESCDQEMKALKDSLAKAQQENENLKNTLKETEKKLASGPGSGADASALEDKLKKLEAENAEKIKKLMEQHEKELANQEKKCNENLNAMKTGYETDIRKLTERHKLSMQRLQNLHEDEVKDLNTSYETQMETMQTQSEEAMSDVAKGSVVKLKKLAEKHAQEMKTMENKVGNLESDLTRSREDLRKARQNAEEIAAQLQAKHAREMQKARRTSSQKLNALKEAFDQERNQLQEEAENLRKKLKEMEASGGGGGICDCKTAKPKPKIRDPTCPLDFHDVLEKILERGMDSLTFNEIALVHRKACCALEGIMMNSRVCPTLEPPVGDSCPHTPLLEADKQQLLSRIFSLEKDILQKQRQTQETIISMELAIKKERCRLQELKNCLENEQQRNSELKMLLSSQTKIESDLKKERDMLGNQASLHQSLCEEKSRQLDEELKNKKYLEMEVERLKCKLKQLQMTVNTENACSDCQQSNQFDLMRMKLEQSMNQERRLAQQLENEAKYRIQLQCQLQALKQSFRQMVNLPEVERGVKLAQNPLEAKSAKERQNLDQIKEKKNKIKTKSSSKKQRK